MLTLFKTVPTDLFRLVCWLVLASLIFIPLERWIPNRRQPVIRKNFWIDISLFFISGILPKFLLVIPLSWLASFAHSTQHIAYYYWVGAQPMAVRFVLALIAGDFGAYWAHKLCHDSPILWHFHRLHHSAEHMDWLVNTRAHPVDICFTRLGGLLPIYLLGLGQATSQDFDIVPVLYTVFSTVWAFFIHSNVAFRLGPLELLLSSPAFHHWHHSVDDPAGEISRNYAALFPWIDRIFNTFWLPSKRWPDAYGLQNPPD